MKSFFIFFVKTYNLLDQKEDKLLDYVPVKVIANSSHEAIEKAKKIADRKQGLIAEITEFPDNTVNDIHTHH